MTLGYRPDGSETNIRETDSRCGCDIREDTDRILHRSYELGSEIKNQTNEQRQAVNFFDFEKLIPQNHSSFKLTIVPSLCEMIKMIS